MDNFRRAFPIIVFFITSSLVSAQDWNLIFTLESDAEYYMAVGNYSRAANTYLKALKQFPESANLKFKTAYCLLKTVDRKSEAISYLEEAVQKVSDSYDARSLKEPMAPPEAYYQLGIAYMLKNDFDRALKAFKKYKGYLTEKEKEPLLLTDQHIKSCSYAKELIKHPIGITIHPLPQSINNNYSNLNPVLSGDGNTLAYTNETNTGNRILVSQWNNGEWSKPRDITRQLGSKYLTTSFLSFDGSELYLIENDIKNSEIVVSRKKKNKWSKTDRMPKPIRSKHNESHISFSRDGKTAYFTSDRRGGQGGFDIYKTTLINGKWSEPENLGPIINSPLDETAPFLTPDQNYLFFCSQGHSTIGGFDIFYVNVKGSPVVKNIGYPLNTTDNELFFFPTGLTSGYVSQFNEKSNQLLDINRVELLPQVDVRLNILLAENAPTDKPYRITIINTQDGKTVSSLSGKGKTQLKERLSPGSYTIEAQGKGFEPTGGNLDIPAKPKKSEFNFSLMLTPEKVKPQPEPLAEEPAADSLQNNTTAPPTDNGDLAESLPQTPPPHEKREIFQPVKTSKPEQPQTKLPPPTAPSHRPTISLPVEYSTYQSQRVTYSVQLLASKQPVDYSYFKLDSIFITLSPEGYYRYSIGNYSNVNDAEKLLEKVKTMGFTDAWIRINRVHPGYTIQIMALSVPRSLTFFDNISDIMVYRGSDKLYRYCVGVFDTIEMAQNQLPKLHEFGYNQAFIRVLGR